MGAMSGDRRRQRPDFWRDLGTRLLEHHGVATVVWRSGTVTFGNGVALELVGDADDGQTVDDEELLRRLDAGFVLPEVAHALHPGEERVVEVEIAATRALLRASAVAVGGVDDEGPLSLVTFRAPLETPVDPAHLARLEAMLDTTSDIITVLDLDGRIMFSNSAAGRLTGLAGTEVNGMSMVELVHPEDVPHVMDAFQRGVLRGEELGVVEVRLRMADGEWHHFEARISGAVEVDGIEGRVITLNDVSDRVGREADGLSHRRRLESIVENIDEVIVILGEDLSVKWASPGIDQLIDAPAYTNVGESAFNDMHPDDVEGVIAAIGAASSRPDGRSQATFRLEHARYGWRWVDAVVVNRLDDPSIGGLVCTLRDVTDQRDRDAELRRLAEQDRREAAALRQSDALKDRFLTTVSHELRTPLASLLGFSRVLDNQWDAIDDESRRELLGRISANAEAMDGLVERLLDFSRLQADAIEIEVSPLDLDAAVGELIDDLEHQLADHEVVTDLGGHRALADRDALGHVMRNLLTNAARYSNAGTKIEVRAERSRDRVLVHVVDHGIGIAPDDQVKVFQSFYQSAPGFPQRRGTGIGLNIARRYAQLQSGHLTLESTLGEGSTFTLDLPAAD